MQRYIISLILISVLGGYTHGVKSLRSRTVCWDPSRLPSSQHPSRSISILPTSPVFDRRRFRKRSHVDDEVVHPFIIEKQLSEGKPSFPTRILLVSNPHTPATVRLPEKLVAKTSPKESITPATLNTLKEEEMYMSQCRSEHVAETFGMMENGKHGRVAMLMEYANGGDLAEWREQKQFVSDDEYRYIFAQIVLAVKRVHDQKLAHRDIKFEST